ncbi:MAG: hypothetical protein IPQ07_30585 [Myxococcales bacterium]|nr:hypothetical protein [Myxococcales bacterium]
MPTMYLARDGRRIVVTRGEALAIIDHRGSQPAIELSLGPIHASALCGDQIWVVAGVPATLTILDLRGTVLATASVPEPGPTPRLIRAANTALATWLGVEPVAIAYTGSVSVTPLPIDVELVLPLSQTRSVIAARRKLSMRDQHAVRWTNESLAFAPVSDAAMVFDGKAAALVVGERVSQTIVVVGLRDGVVLHRISVGAARVRFAPVRSAALLHTEDGRLQCCWTSGSAG